jgi:NAD(P)-dependent dehydrogenase (short-subunit alcohol dehydrogenase family)
VSVASNAHRAGELDFDDLLHENDYEGWAAYSRSKLANILFTRALARRLAGTGVTANCLHPGLVRSRFFETLGGWAAMEAANPGAVGVSPTQGAATIVYLASSTDIEGVSGEYFYECEIAPVTDAASDDQAAERLWTESLRLAALESIQDFSALAPESRARGGHL